MRATRGTWRKLMATILIIEDEEVLARNMRDSLALAGHVATCVGSGEQGIKQVESDPPDVVIVDYRLPGKNGLEVLQAIRQSVPRTGSIMVTAHGDVAMAVQAMKAGAVEFLPKPLDLDTLHLIVDRVVSQQHVTDDLNYFRNRDRKQVQSEPIIGESSVMRKIKERIIRLVSTSALSVENPPTILITGETGTGKGLIARAIHYNGPRRDGKFIHVNCTAIADHLAESEFFGHVKGAFTDARKEKRGLFELANKGTIFLDEIGHMPMSLQSKLLGVLEQRTIRPVGGTRDHHLDVHVIAATNRIMDEAIESGSFRQDLYHRLQVLRIEVPALRVRGHDIEMLARHFLRHCSQRYGLDIHDISAPAVESLLVHDWPGNVRELQHAIESASLIADSRELKLEHFALQTAPTLGGVTVACQPQEQTITIDFAHDPPPLSEVEYSIIRAALEYANHNLSRASRLLGISRDAIRYRVERFEKESSSKPPLEDNLDSA